MTKKLVPVEDESESNIARTPRWVAASVMLSACVGFVGLAYYAYHAGTRSIKDEELMLVEADSAPVKEKPADPGGMKFPNQDKAIFDAISNNPEKVAKVERVLPGPEEPVSKDQLATAQGEQAKTWVNEKLNEDASALIEKTPDTASKVAEAVKSAEEAAKAMAAQAQAQAVPNAAAEAIASISPSAGSVETASSSSSGAANAPEEGVVVTSTLPEMKVEEKPAEPAVAGEAPAKVELTKPQSAPAEEKPVVEKPAAEKSGPAKSDEKPVAKAAAKPAAKAKNGGSVAQLGAYRSEAEARKAWDKLKGRHNELASSSPDIQKAEVGGKGVFYRLRVSVSNAKELCQKLSAKGQACIVAGK